jgi:glycosyltransferase involved in cell wall biosynthesis
VKISVILPTYNPSIDRLTKTINGLINQSLNNSFWELIIIDNNSSSKFEQQITIPSNAKIVIEKRQGLTFARLKGFEMAKGSLIIMVDDDNVLDENYLENCLSIFNEYPKMGAIGGNIEGEFEIPPPYWTKDFLSLLAIRNLGQKILTANIHLRNNNKIDYPLFSPVGAGMAIRKIALNKYLEEVQQNTQVIADRSGNSLTSSGDNEIVMQIFLNGFDIGFFPRLNLKHIIPTERLNKIYLGKLNKAIMHSWTLFLIKYNQCPWNRFNKITLQFRVIKALIKYAPWKSSSNYIKFNGVVGQLEALSC